VRLTTDGSFQGTSLTKEMEFYGCDEDNIPHLEATKGGQVIPNRG
jgi:hypothetical protein